MNRPLAYFSLALGAMELVAPNLLSRAIGLRPKPGLVRTFGVREMATGLGMLTLPRSPARPGARLAGNAVDLRNTRRGRIVALLAVAGVMALNIYAARRAASRNRAVEGFRGRNRIPTLAAASPH